MKTLLEELSEVDAFDLCIRLYQRNEEYLGYLYRAHFDLNQYQGGMCISAVLKTTERTLRRLTSPLRPNRGATGGAV